MMTLAEKLLLGAGAGANAESNPYVEFVSSTPMTITLKHTNPGVTLQYSLDAESWTTVASSTTIPSANIVYFRGSATGTKSLYNAAAVSNAWAFTGATNLECNGKLDRLIQNTLGGDTDILAIDTSCFAWMFFNVTTLIKAPALPVTTLATNCYSQMFRNCTSLTIAPELPATVLAASCYYGMFYGCTSLTIAPALPVTTLAANCYNTMFYGCTGLTTAPELPATALTVQCYYGMFNGCSSLKLSTTMTGIYDTAYRIPTVGTGTTATDALKDMFTGTGGTFKSTPTINTTYYTENTPV